MKISRFFQILVVSTLILGAIGTATPQQTLTAKAQPQLLELAASNPGQVVRLIAQKMDGAKSVEELVANLGGRVLTDLSIINAFAAEMTAEAALELARSEDVRWVSLDAAVTNSGKPTPQPSTYPSNYYLDTMGVRSVWNMGLTGEGIGVAVIDSGIKTDRDFSTVVGKPFTRVIVQKNFNDEMKSVSDEFGHGTAVAAIIGGNGGDSPDSMYSGVAPKVNLINLKVNDDTTGMCYESAVVAAMQWIYENKTQYNIRVVNLSLNSSVEQSYNISPMDAAAEVLWFNGVVVVASAGNKGPAGSYNTVNAAPANDPFIITVGASDEKGSASPNNDMWAPFSAFGITTDGYVKPDLMAPGTSIYSLLSSSSTWGLTYPDRVVGGKYIRLSGTSMSAPMVTGVVALLLQDEPNLTPDQVKYRLMHTASWLTGRYIYLNAYAAVTGTTTQSANTGQRPSSLLATGPEAIDFTSIGWNSIGWNSIGWNSIGWNSIGWNSIGWNSIGWNSTFWGQ